MNVVYEESTLEYNLSAAASVSPDHPVVITKFIDNAQEIDVDAVAHKGQLLVHAVSELDPVRPAYTCGLRCGPGGLRASALIACRDCVAIVFFVPCLYEAQVWALH